MLPSAESAFKEGNCVLSSVLQYYYASAPPVQCFTSRLAVIQQLHKSSRQFNFLLSAMCEQFHLACIGLATSWVITCSLQNLFNVPLPITSSPVRYPFLPITSSSRRPLLPTLYARLELTLQIFPCGVFPFILLVG